MLFGLDNTIYRWYYIFNAARVTVFNYDFSCKAKYLYTEFKDKKRKRG